MESLCYCCYHLYMAFSLSIANLHTPSTYTSILFSIYLCANVEYSKSHKHTHTHTQNITTLIILNYSYHHHQHHHQPLPKRNSKLVLKFITVEAKRKFFAACSLNSTSDANFPIYADDMCHIRFSVAYRRIASTFDWHLILPIPTEKWSEKLLIKKKLNWTETKKGAIIKLSIFEEQVVKFKFRIDIAIFLLRNSKCFRINLSRKNNIQSDE